MINFSSAARNPTEAIQGYEPGGEATLSARYNLYFSNPKDII